MGTWTQTEKTWLRENYLQTKPEERYPISPEHSYMAIKMMACRLGITKKSYYIAPDKSPLIKIALSDYEKGYLAGIIDGDGSIGLRNAYPYIQVINTSLHLIKQIKAMCRDLGHIYICKRRGKIDRYSRQICYSYQINKWRDVETIITAIYPFLILKQEKARSVLDYIDEFIRKRRLSANVTDF